MARAQADGGTGEFWATENIQEATWFAQSNNANGQAAMLTFEVSAEILVRLLSAIPPQAQWHQDDGLEFFPTSFPTLNRHMRNKRVLDVP